MHIFIKDNRCTALFPSAFFRVSRCTFYLTQSELYIPAKFDNHVTWRRSWRHVPPGDTVLASVRMCVTGRLLEYKGALLHFRNWWAVINQMATRTNSVSSSCAHPHLSHFILAQPGSGMRIIRRRQPREGGMKYGRRHCTTQTSLRWYWRCNQLHRVRLTWARHVCGHWCYIVIWALSEID